MFNSKKGQAEKLSFDALIQLAIVLIAFIALGTVYLATSRGNDFEKAMLAIDQALITDSLYIGQGNTFLAYPIIPINLLYDFLDDSINVYEEGDVIKVSYNYIPSLDILTKQVLELGINKTEQLQFLKSANEITLGKNLSYNSYLEECPKIKPVVKEIVFMPKTIDNKTNKLAKNLKKVMETEVRIENRASKNFDILIKIIKNQNPNEVEINIPFNSVPSKRLACLIANSLMQKEDLIKLNIPIIPSNKLFFRGFDKVAPYRAILSISLGEDFNKTSNFFIMSSAFREYTK